MYNADNPDELFKDAIILQFISEAQSEQMNITFCGKNQASDVNTFCAHTLQIIPQLSHAETKA